MGSRIVAGMLTLLRFIVSVLVRQFRSRAVLELENLALRHQLQVLRRQRAGRPRLLAIDRLLWVCLYRLWPRCLEVMVLVKPARVIQWHRQGFRLFWRWRSRSGQPSVDLSLDKDCPTPARSCHAGSEGWSPPRSSAACITVTNVSPPDSYPIPAQSSLRLGQSAFGRILSVSQTLK